MPESGSRRGVSGLGGSAPGGVSAPGGAVSVPGRGLVWGGICSGGVCLSAFWDTTSPPVNRMTNRCKNITLATTLLRLVKIKMRKVCCCHPKEVWGKVMFLHLSVILFTGGRGSLSGGLCPGGALCRVGGVSVRETPYRDRDPHTVKSGRYASYWKVFLSQ